MGHGMASPTEPRRIRARGARFALGLVPVLLALGYAGELRTARAQRSTQDELVLAVAKVAANEASLATIRPAEVALIWQVTEARGHDDRSRLAWLRAHSSCVLTDRPMSDRQAAGNCSWSRHLRADGRRPEGWPQHLSWPRYASRWAQVRELARRLVIGEEPMRPCPSTPWTWGGPMDREAAIERGLVPLNCRDPQTGERTRNDGFALAGGES